MLNRLSCFSFAAFLLTAGCSGDDGLPTTPTPPDEDAAPAQDAAPTKAAPSDAGDAGADAPAETASGSSDASADAHLDLDAGLDARADADAATGPCATAAAVVARCTSLAGTAGIAGSDVDACIDAMRTVRVGTCFTFDQVTAFDETALEVLESAEALTQATCDLAPLQARMQWTERYVTTARALANPAEPVDSAKLGRLDDAFWRGVYWGDPRGASFNRETLRTMRTDALACAEAAIDAAFTPLGSTQTMPLTTAPLVGIAGEALSALGEGYDWTTIEHELACDFVSCAAPELPGASVTWNALAALDDGAALKAALGPGTSAVWPESLGRFATYHTVFEASVLDATGAATYSPALLSGSSSPAFQALVDTRDHARGLVAAFASDGAYIQGPPNDLYGYAGRTNYITALDTDLTAQYSAVQAADSTLTAAITAFTAGTESSYDATDLLAARRHALQWTAAHVPPLVELAFPDARTALASEQSLEMLTEVADAPTSAGDLVLGDLALDSISNEVGMEDVDSLVYTTQVVVSFPNPNHTPIPNETAIPWTQIDAVRAKAVWDAIAAKSSATITLTPDDIYRVDGGIAVLVCTQAAPIVVSEGLLVDFAPSVLPPNGNIDVGLHVPFTAGAEQPYVTAGGPLVDFRTEDPNTQASAIHAEMVDETSAGPPPQSIFFEDVSPAGTSPFASATIDFAAVSKAIGADLTAPRSLTLVINVVIVAVAEGSPLTAVTACR